MGDPKNPRRAWRKPKRPFNYELKMEELKTLGTFGLKTKRELWKARTELSRVRKQARSLLALRKEVREKREPVLMKSLSRIGLVEQDSTLDDVLNLQVTDLLSRRLQTIVLKKFAFQTPYQARQAVTHGHIIIGDRRVNIPSYIVKIEEENNVRIAPESSLKDLLSKIEPKTEPVSEETGVSESVEKSTEVKNESDSEAKDEKSTEVKNESDSEAKDQKSSAE